MATTLTYKNHASNPIAVLSNSDLNGLVSAQAKKTSSAIANASDGYKYGYFVVDITFASAPSADQAIEIWFCQTIDAGTNYEDFTDGASPSPGQYLACVFLTRAATTLKRASALIAIPPYDFHVMLVNKAGVNFHASTAGTLKLHKVTDQAV